MVMQSKVVAPMHLRPAPPAKSARTRARIWQRPCCSTDHPGYLHDGRMQPDGSDVARMWRVSPAGYFDVVPVTAASLPDIKPGISTTKVCFVVDFHPDLL